MLWAHEHMKAERAEALEKLRVQMVADVSRPWSHRSRTPTLWEERSH